MRKYLQHMIFCQRPGQIWRLASTLTGLALVAAAFWAWSAGFDRKGTLPADQIRHAEGRMYSVAVPDLRFPFVSPQDTPSAPMASRLRLFESGRALGPAHDLHATIRQAGGGAFSHWNGALLFSTSDNSDPATNGRPYAFSQTIFLPFWAVAGLILLGALLCWPAMPDLSRRLTASGVRPADIFAPPQTLRRAVLAYGLLLCLPALVAFLAVGARTAPKTVAALGADRALTERVAAYLEDQRSYSVIFIGDSRTYCNIHPELIEPLVPGMRGLNLSNFANWLPTQLGLVRDIAGRIPPETTVVWSLGHQNFSGLGSGTLAIQRIYPIGIADAARLAWWNSLSMPRGLVDNLYYFHWYLHGFVTAREYHGALDRILKRQLFANLRLADAAMAAAPGAANASDLAHAAGALEREAVADPNIVQATATVDGGRITSIIRYYRRGGHHRTEIDAGYFRTKQAEFPVTHRSDAEAAAFEPAPPAPMEWAAFITILDILAANKVRLVVNEVEEAPYVYGHPLVRSKWRQMMRERVQPEIERRGFAYIRTDLDRLSDADYFDYNHMNSSGIEKYTPMLAQRLNELRAGR